MRLKPVQSLVLIAAVWSAWFIIHTVFRHLNFFSSSFDLGNMDQVLWQTLHGHFFQMTSPTEGILQSRAAIHADWLLLIYLPFYALWQSPLVMTSLQIIAVASAVFPIFWLARGRLSPNWSLTVATLYLLQPTLQWSIIFDVHALVLVTPLILWGVWAATSGRFVLMWIFFLAALAAKEEVGLVIALTALILGWQKILSRRMAWTLGVTSLSWVWFVTAIMIPAAAVNGSHFAISYFSEYGQTVPQILIGFLRHPIVLWHDLVNLTSLGYLVIIFGSVALLPLLRPRWLLPALPIFIMNLISNQSEMHSIFYQYTAALTPFLILASLDGLALATPRWSSQRVVIWMVAWVSVIVWMWAPLPGTRHHGDATKVFVTNPYRTEVKTLVREIPKSISLVVSNDLGPQFSQRDRVWVFPEALVRAQTAVILLNRPRDTRPQAELKGIVATMQNDPLWKLVRSWNNELYYFAR